MHVPVGQPFKLTVTSEDVIHCLAIPGQKIKVEAIPGKWTSDWTTSEKAGRYPFHCSENCGAMHAKHTGTLVVLERKEYDNRLAGLLPKEPRVEDGALAWNGRKLFLKNQCLTCHSAEVNAKGPNLEGLWGKAVAIKGGGMVRVEESYIRESILRPLAKVVEGWEPIMPAFDKEKISEEEMIALIAYIKSLKPGDTPKRTEETPPQVGAPPKKK